MKHSHGIGGGHSFDRMKTRLKGKKIDIAIGLISAAALVALALVSTKLVTQRTIDQQSDDISRVTDTSVSDTERASPEKPEPPKTATKDELLAEVNRWRAEVGVAPLQYSPELERSAQIKCDDMNTRDYFDHEDPDGRTGPKIAMEITGWIGIFGENLTMRRSTDDADVTVISEWFESEPHRDAALDPQYTLTGFGACGDLKPDSTENKTYFVEHFYAPQATSSYRYPQHSPPSSSYDHGVGVVPDYTPSANYESPSLGSYSHGGNNNTIVTPGGASSGCYSGSYCYGY